MKTSSVNADIASDMKPRELDKTAAQISGLSITKANWDGQKQSIMLGSDLEITWNGQTKSHTVSVNGMAAEELQPDQRAALAGVLKQAREAQGRSLALFVAKPVKGLPANYHLHLERFLADGAWSDLADYPRKL